MIIKCSECGGVVSDRAAACPHCGAPVASGPDYRTPIRDNYVDDSCAHGTLCWWMGFIFQVFGIIIGAIISGGYGAKKALFGMLWSWALYFAFIFVLVATCVAFG